MPEQIWWFLTRASGIVAYFLLFAAALWGALLVSRLADSLRRPAWMLDLHSWLGGMSVLITGVHMGALVADDYVHFAAFELLVPFYSGYQRWATALGVIAMWSIVLVQVSSLLRRRIPRRVWRAIHLSSYGAFLASSFHGTYVGTDSSQRLYVLASTAAIGLMILAIVDRLLFARRQRGRTKSSKVASTVS